MSSIPLEFDPSPIDDREHYLEDSEAGEIKSICWKQMGLRLSFTKTPYLDEADLVKHTPALRFHNHFGFSLGRYHEFFIQNVPTYMHMRLGNVEVSIGQPTPLAIDIFDVWHDKHFHGEYWDAVSTVRITDAAPEHFESYLLTALRHYRDRYQLYPTLMQFDGLKWWEDPDEESDKAPSPPLHAAVCADIEPLRFLHYGDCETDPASAFIQHYRVIEFYAFFSQQHALSTIRRDNSISDRDFLTQAAHMLTRDEKGPVIRLVVRLSGPALLQEAVAANLIKTPDASSLGNALYDFRNSAVHAKYDQRASLVVDSAVAPSALTANWGAVMRKLAVAAIDTLGAKLIP